jgi:hypothetical protein
LCAVGKQCVSHFLFLSRNKRKSRPLRAGCQRFHQTTPNGSDNSLHPATRFFVFGSGTDPMWINAAEPCCGGLWLAAFHTLLPVACSAAMIGASVEAECHRIRFGKPPEQMQSSAQTLRGRPLSSASCSFDHVIFVDPLAVCVFATNSRRQGELASRCSSVILFQQQQLLNNSKSGCCGPFLPLLLFIHRMEVRTRKRGKWRPFEKSLTIGHLLQSCIKSRPLTHL